ncbi:hypothetical protein PPGU19_088810 (plasmid) [Paraburkholderia sp. PGU19]|nr:hypothetical protein PPGU19_088810 [Paraburkholderia sp. PGU19]
MKWVSRLRRQSAMFCAASCTGYQCPGHPTPLSHDTGAKAIGAWNRRAAVPASPARNEAPVPNGTAAVLDAAISPCWSWINRHDRVTDRDLAPDVFNAMRKAAPQPRAAWVEPQVVVREATFEDCESAYAAIGQPGTMPPAV